MSSKASAALLRLKEIDKKYRVRPGDLKLTEKPSTDISDEESLILRPKLSIQMPEAHIEPSNKAITPPPLQLIQKESNESDESDTIAVDTKETSQEIDQQTPSITEILEENNEYSVSHDNTTEKQIESTSSVTVDSPRSRDKTSKLNDLIEESYNEDSFESNSEESEVDESTQKYTVRTGNSHPIKFNTAEDSTIKDSIPHALKEKSFNKDNQDSQSSQRKKNRRRENNKNIESSGNKRSNGNIDDHSYTSDDVTSITSSRKFSGKQSIGEYNDHNIIDEDEGDGRQLDFKDKSGDSSITMSRKEEMNRSIERSLQADMLLERFDGKSLQQSVSGHEKGFERRSEEKSDERSGQSGRDKASNEQFNDCTERQSDGRFVEFSNEQYERAIKPFDKPSRRRGGKTSEERFNENSEEKSEKTSAKRSDDDSEGNSMKISERQHEKKAIKRPKRKWQKQSEKTGEEISIKRTEEKPKETPDVQPVEPKKAIAEVNKKPLSLKKETRTRKHQPKAHKQSSSMVQYIRRLEEERKHTRLFRNKLVFPETTHLAIIKPLELPAFLDNIAPAIGNHPDPDICYLQSRLCDIRKYLKNQYILYKEQYDLAASISETSKPLSQIMRQHSSTGDGKSKLKRCKRSD